MRRVVRQIWESLRRSARPRSKTPKGWERPIARLECLLLEDRVLPSASTLGTISGTIFIAGNQNFNVQGIQVTLSNSSGVVQTATTDVNGGYAFRSVDAGTYKLAALAGDALINGDSVSNVSVSTGTNTSENMSVGGLSAAAVSLRELTNNFSFSGSFSPLGSAGTIANSAPVFDASIANMILSSGGAAQTIDLAAHFTDPDMNNQSEVQFQMNDGNNMNIMLTESSTPQTVANFFDYVESGRYDGSFYHRLTNPKLSGVTLPIMQGGGFTLQTNGSGDVTGFNNVANSSDPNLMDEATNNAGNLQGTIAMANTGAGNSAQSGFFFNLANNSNSLGGAEPFTAFGHVASDPASQAELQKLETTTTFTVQQASQFQVQGDPVPTLPLVNYHGLTAGSTSDTNFPGDTTPANWVVINHATVLRRDEFLTYSASSSDTTTVTATIDPQHPEYLKLTPSLNLTQQKTATITVTAKDVFGASAKTTFQVTVDPLSIQQVPSTINNTNDTSVPISGFALPGAKINLAANDGTSSTVTGTATALANGTWSATLNVSSLVNTTIAFSATSTAPDGTSLKSNTLTATKHVANPAITISSVNVNGSTATVSGTGDSGDAISVTATDSSNGKAGPATTNVQADKSWQVVLDISNLASGSLNFVAKAIDGSGNTNTASSLANKV
jgi:cyclophilin family peptidyl-prolyl cis-trans isomerase